MTQQLASAVCCWETVMRAADWLLFKRCVPWGDGLWFVQWHCWDGRSLSRDIVVDPVTGWVTTKDDADV